MSEQEEKYLQLIETVKEALRLITAQPREYLKARILLSRAAEENVQ